MKPRFLLVSVLAATLTASASLIPVSFAGPIQPRQPTTSVSSFAATSPTLLSVSALARRDVWAAGVSDSSSYKRSSTAVRHWEGRRWSAVKSVDPSAHLNGFHDIVAVAANDVWAVGYFGHWGQYSAITKTLVEHWDGTGWEQVPSPDLAGASDGLISVAAVSATDIWAVGSADFNAGDVSHAPVIVHWNGKRWATVPSPAGPERLVSVSAVATDDVWAAGDGIVEHWDGKQWSIVFRSPAELTGISAASADDSWVVGTMDYHSNYTAHWDGSTWSQVASPGGDVRRKHLQAVSVESATDAWAVGRHQYKGVYHNATQHWDGTSWTTVKCPSQPYQALGAVDARTPTDVWAVGNRYPADMAFHWDGSDWTAFAVP